MNSDILEIIDSALALAGYNILEGDTDTLYIKDRKTGTHYVIKVNELTD